MSESKREEFRSKTQSRTQLVTPTRPQLDGALPMRELTLALNSPFSKQLEERIDILSLLADSEVRDEAIVDFLRHFEYLQQEYIRPLFEEEGDIHFMPEYVITHDDDEHPDHYALIRLLASMIEQCQPDKAPNLSEEDLVQMSHIAGR